MSALLKGNPFKTHAEQSAYLRGYTDALWDFAWQKDGEYRVGSGFFTHKHALEEALKAFLPSALPTKNGAEDKRGE